MTLAVGGTLNINTNTTTTTNGSRVFVQNHIWSTEKHGHQGIGVYILRSTWLIWQQCGTGGFLVNLCQDSWNYTDMLNMAARAISMSVHMSASMNCIPIAIDQILINLCLKDNFHWGSTSRLLLSVFGRLFHVKFYWIWNPSNFHEAFQWPYNHSLSGKPHRPKGPLVKYLPVVCSFYLLVVLGIWSEYSLHDMINCNC